MRRRVRMAPDARREIILDAAQALFMERGWDTVTIADVQKKAGISRGGFYHHFAAKEDLLSGLIARMTEQAVQSTNTPSAPSGNALAILNSFLAGAAQWTADNINELRGFVKIFSQPGNEVLYRRICDAEADVVMPLLSAIIDDGIAEGTFDAIDAALTGELMLSLSQGRREVLIAVFDLAEKNDLDAAVEVLSKRLRSEGEICDRLLGVPLGSVVLSNPTEYRRMLEGLIR